jgi:murein DD-endopeptidase MepM/ murein hydrolase activator NlpD
MNLDLSSRHIVRSLMLLLAMSYNNACSSHNAHHAPVEQRGEKFFGWDKNTISPTDLIEQKNSFKSNNFQSSVIKNHIVQPKEGLYSIARQYGLPAELLIRTNHLSPPYTLKSGDILQVPNHSMHQVKHGDTLRSIARKHGTDIMELSKINKVSKDYHVKLGEYLLIPKQNKLAHSIAVKSNQSQSSSDLSIVNNSINNKEITTDTNQKTPNIVGQNGASPVQRFTQQLATERGNNKTPNISDESKNSSELSMTSPSVQAEEIEQPTENMTIKGNGTFIWPIKGKIISYFGPKVGGARNDGINISAPAGTPIRAAGSGVIVYAGNELKGYGNLTIIRHANGYLSAYAHQQTIDVRKGQQVKIGHIIGRVGNTGNVSNAQLHFGIRQGKKPVNPISLLD